MSHPINPQMHQNPSSKPYQNPPLALNSDLDSLKYRIYPSETLQNEANSAYSYEKDPLPYENSPIDLETVPERSIESELTYKTSILDLPTNKNSFKGETEDFFPNSTRKSEQKAFRTSYDPPYLLSPQGLNQIQTPRSPLLLEDKIKIVDNLKPDELHWKLRALSIENETFRAENMKYKEEYHRIKTQSDIKLALLEKENLKMRKSVEEKEEEVFFRRQEARKVNEELKALRSEREAFYKQREIWLEEKEDLERGKQALLRKNKEIELSFQLQIEEATLLQSKRLEERLNEIILEKQYQYHTKEKRLKSENETLRFTNDSLIQKIDLLSNRKPNIKNNIDHHNNKNNDNYPNNHSLLESILAELDIKASSLEDIHLQISEFKTQHRQVIRFADLVLEMTANCHPKDTFPNGRPSLKQAWKWLKTVLESYMQLKKSTMKDGMQGALAQEENEELVNKMMENLAVKRKSDILGRFYQCLHENNLFNRMLPKIKRLLKLDKRSTAKEIERKLDELV